MSNPEQINSYGTVYDTYTKQGKAKPSAKPKTPSKETKPSTKPKTPSKEAKSSAKLKTISEEINVKPSAKLKTPREETKPSAKPKTPSEEVKSSAKLKTPREETKPKPQEGKEIEVKFPRKRRVILEGAPKKPLNSYQLFVQTESKRDIYMGLPPRERMSKVAAVWRERSRVEI